MSQRPQPTQLKIIRGNPGKRALNKNEPMPELVMPDAPDHLSDNAKSHWNEVVGQLYDAKIMTALDVDALSMYCEAYARWVEANESIRKFGMVVKSPSGYPMQTPWLSISNAAFKQMKDVMVEFGMTPSSRSKVNVTSKQESNPFDDV